MKTGEKVYYSKRINIPNAIVQEYEKPKQITLKYNYFTCMKASGYMAIIEYGEQINSTWICIANSNYFKDKISKGDLFWVGGKTPLKENELTETIGYGESANAIVVDVLETDHTIKIVLENNENEQENIRR